MLKIRRPLGRLIFNMGIAIPGKTVFLIETAPWLVKKPRGPSESQNQAALMSVASAIATPRDPDIWNMTIAIDMYIYEIHYDYGN